jgi:hypothetical protein
MNQPARTSPPDAARLSQQAVHTAVRAARYDLYSYPGPIGELIDRELRAYIDTGHALPPTALPELVEPGVVRLSEWRPDLGARVGSSQAVDVVSMGGVGRKR